MKIARTYVISGRVQGVGYRYFAQRLAQEHGIFGYVKNLSNGSVEVYAIGNENTLDQFKRQLAEGPRSARVTGIEESEETVREKYGRFVIEG
ncbi:MAG: acylphosphatase [Terriglobia bacterium]